ncbi:hypothetical protein [Caulobacter sp. 17J65-9]|uniref:hypothetical protein n=1 Tax=Caulobacter sp. 17J65-9 TaxID=2709382 RepID=UPI001969F15F|nr:hypothetical protein [Caulobacter sp. 17J65-9]
MARPHDQDPRQRPTEGRRDLRNLNLDPQDIWDEPVSRSDAVEAAGFEAVGGAGREPRSFLERGAGATNADAGPTPICADGEENADYARRARPLAPDEKPDQLADKDRSVHDRQDALMDEAVEETFPASDPVSPKHIT